MLCKCYRALELVQDVSLESYVGRPFTEGTGLGLQG